VETKIEWNHGANSNQLYRPEGSLTGGKASPADTIHCAETSPNGGPIGLPSRDSTKMDGKLKQLVPGQSLAQYGHLKIEIISNYWSAVVIMYSKCDLTFGRDKLIALSGIAREVQKLIHTGYMAGMWENQLPHSLMWRVSMATCIHRPQLHVAPSWS
jgi:hypothetical protein